MPYKVRRLSGPMLLLFLAAVAIVQATSVLKLDKVLSLYVLNSAYYGTWQGDSNPRTSKRLRIAVVGKDPMKKELEVIGARAQTTWFKGGQIVIVKADDIEDLTGEFHVAFIGDGPRLRKVVDHFTSKPTITISNRRGFAEDGGTIELRLRNERLSFFLNLDQLSKSGVTLHSKMRIRASGFIKNGRFYTTYPGGSGTR